MSDLSKPILSRRQFVRWGLMAGGLDAELSWNTSKALSTNSVKILLVPQAEDGLELSFNPMSILRNFDRGIKQEAGRTIREFEIFSI